MGFKPDPITGGPKLDTSPTSSVTVSGFKPDQEEYKEPSFGEKSGAVAYGAGTGVVGSLGELEKFGAYTVPETLGFREEGQKDNMGFGRETLFPTIDDARKYLEKIGVTRPREEVRGYETGGEIIGGLATSAPGLIKTGVKGLLGVPSKTSEAIAQEAEKLGFKLSPAQVRQDVPLSAQGSVFAAKENQSLANKLASEGTGAQVAEITSDFIGKRLKKLGKEFDNLYKGKSFVVGSEAESALNSILARETELGYAGVSPVKQAAQTMLENIKSRSMVDGENLQRLRNALTERARSSTSRSDAHEIYNLVDVIDASVSQNNPALAEALTELRPKYRNSIILEDLYRKGGIKQGNISLEMLGDMLRGKRDAVRRSGKDIDNLAELGRELKIRARWQETGSGETPGADVLKKALGTTLGGVASLTGLRSATARKAQKGLARNPVKGYEKAGITTGAGAVGGGVFDSNE